MDRSAVDEDRLPLVEWTIKAYTIPLDRYEIYFDRDCGRYDFPMVYWWKNGKGVEETAYAIVTLMNNYGPDDEFIRDLGRLKGEPPTRFGL